MLTWDHVRGETAYLMHQVELSDTSMGQGSSLKWSYELGLLYFIFVLCYEICGLTFSDIAIFRGFQEYLIFTAFQGHH